MIDSEQRSFASFWFLLSISKINFYFSFLIFEVSRIPFFPSCSHASGDQILVCVEPVVFLFFLVWWISLDKQMIWGKRFLSVEVYWEVSPLGQSKPLCDCNDCSAMLDIWYDSKMNFIVRFLVCHSEEEKTFVVHFRLSKRLKWQTIVKRF